MKKLSINYGLAIFLSCLTLTSCNDDDDSPAFIPADSFSSLSDFVESQKPEAQTFTIDPTSDQVITGEDGVVIEIDAGAFTDENDDPITTPITVELKEYLDLKSMFEGNIQTVSNGQLLVTGGNFDLRFKDESGNDVNVNPWSIHSKIPVATDISGYENSMQYYIGETTTVDGREVVNWNIGQAEFWMEEGVFNTLGVQQGLSNCDVLYDMAEENPTQFEVTVSGVEDYSQTAVWMFIEDFPSIVMIYSLNDTMDALETYENSIPEGLNATLLAITIDDDNYLKFGSLPITVSGNDTFNVDVAYGTTADLSALIDNILN